MSFKYKKSAFSTLFLTAVFLCSCQPKTSEANVSNQQNESKNQTAIRVSSAEVDAAETAIASDKDGNVLVVFVEHNADKSADVYLQKVDKNEKRIGEKVRVNPEPKTAKAWFGDAPTIKVGNDNSIYIGWTAKVESEKTTATTLYLSVSRDGGKTFYSPVKVNDDSAPASHAMHSLAVGDDGKVFMTWLDERNIKTEAKNVSGDGIIEPRKNDLPNEFRFVKAHHDSNKNSQNKTEESKTEKKEMSHENVEPNSEVFFAVSNDGGKTFSKNLKISSEVCPCCKTNLAIDENGKIYASWRQVVGDNFRHIAVASSENNGEKFSNPVIVSDDQWQINACPVSGAPMRIDGENTLKIVWFTNGKAGSPGLYFSESKDGGKTFAARKAVFENLISGTANLFADDSGKLRTVFESGGKFYSSDLQNSAREISEGTNPSAIFVNGKIYTSFVKKESGNRGVWLSVAE
jgi:hypothetical protein